MSTKTFVNLAGDVYKTTDYGKTWSQLIAPDSPVRGYAHVVKEDLVNRDLLFVGTEFGLWISLDGRRQWAQYSAACELADVVKDFDAWTAKELSGLNSGLSAKKLEPIKLLARDEWEKSSDLKRGSPEMNGEDERHERRER